MHTLKPVLFHAICGLPSRPCCTTVNINFSDKQEQDIDISHINVIYQITGNKLFEKPKNSLKKSLAMASSFQSNYITEMNHTINPLYGIIPIVPANYE